MRSASIQRRDVPTILRISPPPPPPSGPHMRPLLHSLLLGLVVLASAHLLKGPCSMPQTFASSLERSPEAVVPEDLLLASTLFAHAGHLGSSRDALVAAGRLALNSTLSVGHAILPSLALHAADTLARLGDFTAARALFALLLSQPPPTPINTSSMPSRSTPTLTLAPASPSSPSPSYHWARALFAALHAATSSSTPPSSTPTNATGSPPPGTGGPTFTQGHLPGGWVDALELGSACPSYASAGNGSTSSSTGTSSSSSSSSSSGSSGSGSGSGSGNTSSTATHLPPTHHTLPTPSSLASGNPVLASLPLLTRLFVATDFDRQQGDFDAAQAKLARATSLVLATAATPAGAGDSAAAPNASSGSSSSSTSSTTTTLTSTAPFSAPTRCALPMLLLQRRLLVGTRRSALGVEAALGDWRWLWAPSSLTPSRSTSSNGSTTTTTADEESNTGGGGGGGSGPCGSLAGVLPGVGGWGDIVRASLSVGGGSGGSSNSTTVAAAGTSKLSNANFTAAAAAAAAAAASAAASTWSSAVLTKSMATLGPLHPDTAMALHIQGALLFESGDAAGALLAQRRAREGLIASTSSPSSSSSSSSSNSSFNSTTSSKGAITSATSFTNTSSTSNSSTSTPPPSAAAAAERGLTYIRSLALSSNALLALGQSGRALKYMNSSATLAFASLGRSHPLTATTAGLLALHYEDDAFARLAVRCSGGGGPGVVEEGGSGAGEATPTPTPTPTPVDPTTFRPLVCLEKCAMSAARASMDLYHRGAAAWEGVSVSGRHGNVDYAAFTAHYALATLRSNPAVYTNVTLLEAGALQAVVGGFNAYMHLNLEVEGGGSGGGFPTLSHPTQPSSSSSSYTTTGSGGNLTGLPRIRNTLASAAATLIARTLTMQGDHTSARAFLGTFERASALAYSYQNTLAATASSPASTEVSSSSSSATGSSSSSSDGVRLLTALTPTLPTPLTPSQDTLSADTAALSLARAILHRYWAAGLSLASSPSSSSPSSPSTLPATSSSSSTFSISLKRQKRAKVHSALTSAAEFYVEKAGGAAKEGGLSTIGRVVKGDGSGGGEVVVSSSGGGSGSGGVWEGVLAGVPNVKPRRAWKLISGVGGGSSEGGGGGRKTSSSPTPTAAAGGGGDGKKGGGSKKAAAAAAKAKDSQQQQQQQQQQPPPSLVDPYSFDTFLGDGKGYFASQDAFTSAQHAAAAAGGSGGAALPPSPSPTSPSLKKVDAPPPIDVSMCPSSGLSFWEQASRNITLLLEIYLVVSQKAGIARFAVERREAGEAAALHHTLINPAYIYLLPHLTMHERLRRMAKEAAAVESAADPAAAAAASGLAGLPTHSPQPLAMGLLYPPSALRIVPRLPSSMLPSLLPHGDAPSNWTPTHPNPAALNTSLSRVIFPLLRYALQAYNCTLPTPSPFVVLVLSGDIDNKDGTPALTAEATKQALGKAWTTPEFPDCPPTPREGVPGAFLGLFDVAGLRDSRAASILTPSGRVYFKALLKEAVAWWGEEEEEGKGEEPQDGAHVYPSYEVVIASKSEQLAGIRTSALRKVARLGLPVVVAGPPREYFQLAGGGQAS